LPKPPGQGGFFFAIAGSARNRTCAAGQCRASMIATSAIETGDDVAAMCRACGACCAYSSAWPRFSLEDDASLALIPREYVDAGEGSMRCDGNRCSALVGEVGVMTSCAVYSVRPDVCRACLPSDGACLIARRGFGL
jgi:hypothetical protein